MSASILYANVLYRMQVSDTGYGICLPYGAFIQSYNIVCRLRRLGARFLYHMVVYTVELSYWHPTVCHVVDTVVLPLRSSVQCLAALIYRILPYHTVSYGCTALQAFARLSAVFGGTYMLSKPDATVVYDSEGVVTGVKSVDEEGNPATAATKLVVGDPSTLSTAARKLTSSEPVLFTHNDPTTFVRAANAYQLQYISVHMRKLGRPKLLGD